MTDQEFLDYCEVHSETPRCGFTPAQLARLCRLIGNEKAAEGLEKTLPGVVNCSEQDIKWAVSRARARLTPAPADPPTPADSPAPVDELALVKRERNLLESTLREIDLPNVNIAYCHDGHEIAVLKARYTLNKLNELRSL